MSGHQGITYTSGAPNTNDMRVTDPNAYTTLVCPHCTTKVSAAVLARTSDPFPIYWIRCVDCGKGIVMNADVVSPPMLPGDTVDGLPEDIADAYTEARKCTGAGAHTASEIMCRKILMHVAVDKGADTGKSFAEYLTYLENEGYLTPPMKPWVDAIRKHGNIATHEIPATSKERALGTLTFTTQLLRLVYEMAHRVQQFMPGTTS